jgi:RNA polymerase sigma-70 factor (ECF subfamily)
MPEAGSQYDKITQVTFSQKVHLMSSVKEEALSLEALRAGDRAEFARLVDAYYEMVYRVAVKMLSNPQDAEDVLQETFMKALRAMKQFDGRSKLSTWLYRIATNEALMALRRQGPDLISTDESFETDEGEQEPVQITDWCCLPEKEFMSAEAQRYLDKAIDRLSPSLRAVFVLRDIEGLSTQETAEVLNLSETAVKTRLSRARLQLREDLTSYFGDKLFEGKRVE